MRCLVSGSSGFLGQALCKELTKQGHSVQALPRDWKKVADFDWLFHLATFGNMYRHSGREEIFNANVVRSFALLEATKNRKYEKFVYISSSSVTLPVQTLYSACKKAVEALIESYDKPIIIIRPYSVTGVGEQKEHLIPTLIDAAFTGKIIPFVPEPVHDFIDIEDVVKVIIEAQEGIISVGSGIGYSNFDVLRLVEKVIGREIKTEIVNSMRKYDTTNWVSPQNFSHKPLEQSIREMVEEYGKQRLKA